jgi:class 3 adenylate cyclase
VARARGTRLEGIALAILAPEGHAAEEATAVEELRSAVGKVLVVASESGPFGGDPRSIDVSDESRLLASIAEALAAESELEVVQPTLEFAGYRLELAGHSLMDRTGKEIPLTHSEFCLLRTLAQRAGRVLSRDQLLQLIAGRGAEVYDRSIDMQIVRLRRKIEPDPKHPRLIVTVPNGGYKFMATVREGKPVVSLVPGGAATDASRAPERRYATAQRSETSTHESPPAEARHATILKCDIVGSTSAKKQLDLEEQLDFQNRFEQLIADSAERHGAHIEGIEGDGALVAFGFPNPREDAAESAVRMGLDLIDAVQVAKLVPHVRLQLRVGVASGLVAVIRRPSPAKRQLIAGLTIDLAERLRQRADPDQLVIADSTKRLAAGFFRYEDLGTVPCQGIDEGVHAWRVLGPSSVVSRFDAQRFDPFRGAIIDRTEVLQLLSQAWISALGSCGQAVCLQGDAGIGKSCLARAALDAAVRDGAVALRFDCTPSTSNTPLFPIGVMLQQIAGITIELSGAEKETLAEQLLRRLLPDRDVHAAITYLAPLFGVNRVAVPPTRAPAGIQEQTISTLTRILDGLAAENPVAMLCEDLHWVDGTTAALLARLSADIGRRRALLIVTMRPSIEKPLLDLSTFTTVKLQPLDPSAAADLVRYVAKEPLPDEIVRRIVDRCEGIPLVLEEVARSARDSAQGPEDTTTATLQHGDVPVVLQMVVQSRISRWPRFALIAQSAAVLGRNFSKHLLEQIVPAEGKSEVEEAIHVLAREGLFADPDPGLYERTRFKHAVICDAIYNTLLGNDKRRLHSNVADILSRNYKGTPDAAPDVVAEHLNRAGRYVEAIRLRLVESALTAARGAFVETEGHCLAALALIDKVLDPQERAALQFRLLIQLGVALTGRHGYSAPEVEDAYRRAQAACGAQADAETLYPIMRGLAAVNFMRGNLPTAYDLSLQGMRLAEQSRRVDFRLDAMSMLCYTTLYYGRLSDCCAGIHRCLQLYRAEQGQRLTYPVPQDAATAVLALLPTVLWLLGDVQGAEDALREGLAHVESLDRDFDKAMLHAWIAGTRYVQRRYREALEHASVAVTISGKHGYHEWYGTGALLALLAQSAQCPDPQAVAQASAGYEEFKRQGVRLNASYFLWGLARGYTQIGDIQTAREMLADAFEVATASRETRMIAELLILQAELEPNDAAAAKLLNRAHLLAEEQGAIAIALRAAASMALRAKGDEVCVASARATLDALDGRSAIPRASGWMLEQSLALKRMLNALSRPILQP